jgi:C-terminal processing protease CtpA/Prc
VPGGAADLDGRLHTGDEIVSVDNQNVLSTSHHHVVQLMGKAASNGRVTIGVRRRMPTHGTAIIIFPPIYLLITTILQSFKTSIGQR